MPNRPQRRPTATTARPRAAMRAAGIFVALVLGLAASGANPSAAETNPGDERVPLVRVAIHADEKNLNPFVEPQAQPLTHDLTMLVYDTLFWSQSRLDPDPWLATGAEPSDDFRTWTVSLRDDVTWHDGQPFTADDVAFTFEYFAADGGPGRYGRHVFQHPVFESATVVDDTTVNLTFVGPIPSFKMLPGGDLPILPQHIWEGIADPRADVTSLPVGTGPYRMIDYQPGASYRLEANPNYFLDQPLVNALELRVIPDDQSAYAALQANEVDVVARNVPVDLTAELERNEELEIVGGTRNQSVYLAFNQRNPTLANQQIRQGLSLALDAHDILDIVERGAGRLGTDTWTHPNSPYTRDATGAHLSDRLAAEQLLDAAGYPASADGTRVGPDGQPFSLRLAVDGSLARHVQAAEMVAEQLGLVGVATTIEQLDGPTLAAIRIGDAAAPPADLLVGELESHAHDGPDHLFFLFHSNAGGLADTFANYSNPEFDALVERTLALPAESDERLQLIHGAQDILAQDLPMIALYYPAGQIAYRPAAYDGWTSDEGHGIFTKRSLLAAYADIGEDTHVGPRPEVDPFLVPADDGINWLAVGGIGIAVLAGGAAAVLALRDRFRKTSDVDAKPTERVKQRVG